MSDSSGFRNVILSLAFLVTFSVHLLMFSYGPLVSSIISEMSLNFTQASLIFSASIIAITVIRIPWGICCDHIGFKKSLGIGLFIMGIFGFLRGFSGTFIELLIYQLFLGVGVSAVIPAMPHMVSNWFPKEKIGNATGIYVAGFAFGNMIGLALTPFLLSLFGGWREVFRAYGIFEIVLTIIWWVLVKEYPNSSIRSQKEEKNSSLPFKDNFITILKQKETWLLSGLIFICMGCFDSLSLWLPSILESEGFVLTTAGIIASLLALGFLITSPVSGTLADRFPRKRIMLILGVLSGPAIFLIGLDFSISILVAPFLAGFFLMGIMTVAFMIPVDHPKLSPYVASAAAIISSIGNLGSFILPVMVGYTRDLTGAFFVALLLLAIMGEITVLLAFALKESNENGKRN
ncbi:MAG: nitrate/nitrite transporter [Promethearchaeota archaeon]